MESVLGPGRESMAGKICERGRLGLELGVKERGSYGYATSRAGRVPGRLTAKPGGPPKHLHNTKNTYISIADIPAHWVALHASVCIRLIRCGLITMLIQTVRITFIHNNAIQNSRLRPRLLQPQASISLQFTSVCTA